MLIQRTGAGQASPFLRGLTGPQTLLMRGVPGISGHFAYERQF